MVLLLGEGKYQMEIYLLHNFHAILFHPHDEWFPQIFCSCQFHLKDYLPELECLLYLLDIHNGQLKLLRAKISTCFHWLRRFSDSQLSSLKTTIKFQKGPFRVNIVFILWICLILQKCHTTMIIVQPDSGNNSTKQCTVRPFN